LRDTKKNGGHLQRPVQQRYELIESMKNQYPKSVLCETLQVARSGYLAWERGASRKRRESDAHLREVVRERFGASRQTYGYPRMRAELRSLGHRVGKTRVARLMRECALQGRQRRRYRPRTTQSDHDCPIAPNRLPGRPPTSACDQLWQTDITYIETAEGWLYVATVLDAHSKRILGQAFSETLCASLAVKALQMAIVRRGLRNAPELTLHSDRGVQYASEAFRAQLRAHGMTASMSRRGNCYDNARAESFFSTLKIEHVYRHQYQTRQEARQSIFEWIEGFYNRQRRHSTLGNLCPVDFENNLN
jgi:transposase InsO family protein